MVPPSANPPPPHRLAHLQLLPLLSGVQRVSLDEHCSLDRGAGAIERDVREAIELGRSRAQASAVARVRAAAKSGNGAD